MTDTITAVSGVKQLLYELIEINIPSTCYSTVTPNMYSIKAACKKNY